MTRQKDFQLHALMCLTGGFAGCYSLLRCHDNFGAAQTANLIYMLGALIGGNLQQFLLRLLALACYMAGVESYVLVSHRTGWDPQKWAVLTELGCLTLIGLLPEETNLFLCLYPVFFMLAAQWSVFHGACGYSASTIFSSNNVRQLALAIGEYCCDRSAAQGEKARFFALTLLDYHLGVCAAILCYRLAGPQAIWFCMAPVLVAAYMICHPREAAVRSVLLLRRHRQVLKNTGR